MDTQLPLASKTAVITGGGRGIGAAVASALAAAGAAVVVAARTRTEIDAVAENLRQRGHSAWSIQCDVTEPESVGGLAAGAREHLGQIDILVNNAGISSAAPLHHETLERWNRMMAVNATGTFLCTQAFAPQMAERGWGRVVNIASLAGRTGARYISAYAASKHAMLGFTRCIAAEMAPRGVTVNAVCPGYVDTDMTDRSLEQIVAKTSLEHDEALASILATTPQRRLIQPDEVAHATLMLCLDGARGINGQAIGIDGGEFLG